MDTRYLSYCPAPSPFYARPTGASAWTSYSLPDAPATWLQTRSGDWVNWAPPGFAQRLQGWKLHVSATPENAQEILDTAASYFFARGIIFKHIGTREELINRNSKSANRSSSGKFITVYPMSDSAFEQIGADLVGLLAGFAGPYILSDIRLGDAPVFARHGGFFPLETINALDVSSPAVVTETGLLRADDRQPFYSVFPGVAKPRAVQRAELTAATPHASPLDDYDRIDALVFSNGGGVYRAWKGKTSTIVKEARPHTGIDRRGLDAFTRRRAEWDNLTLLEADEIAPVPVRLFTAWEHIYVEMEDLGGVTLADWAITEYPFSQQASRKAFARKAIEYAHQAIDAMRIVHSRGRVVGDVHPRNFIITEAGVLKLIDLEDNRDPASEEPGGFNAFGYEPPAGMSAMRQDWWSLSRVIASMFHIARPIEVVAPDYWDWSLTWIARQFGDEAVELIRIVSAMAGKPPRHMQFRPDATIAIHSRPEALTMATLSSPSFRAEVVSSIHQMSQRYGTTYRPYPGDIASIGNDIVSLSSPLYGALGVQALLQQAGEAIDDQMVGLITHSLRLRATDNNGLLFGRMGSACLLAEVNRPSEAVAAAKDALLDSGRRQRLDLGSGLAGVTMGALALAQRLDDDELESKARQSARRLSAAVAAGSADAQTERTAGLITGRSGIAYALAAAYTHFGVDEFGQQALDLLAAELNRSVEHPGGRIYLLDVEGRRALPYVNGGSAGALIAIAALRQAGLDAAQFADYVPGLIEACSSDVYAFGGLLNGRIGVASALEFVHGAGVHDTRAIVGKHVTELSQHMLTVDGNVTLVGDQYLRASLDVGTGLSGLLSLSIQLTAGGLPWLPGHSAMFTSPQAADASQAQEPVRSA